MWEKQAVPDEAKSPSGEAASSPGFVRHSYFNGFEISTSLSDMGLILMVDGQPFSRLSFSFTTAKTLALQLSGALAAFEQATDHKVMSMDEVQKGLDASIKSDGE